MMMAPKYPLSLVLCLVVLIVSFPLFYRVLHLSLSSSLFLSLLLSYLPSYVDGSEHDPHNLRFSPRFQRLPIWRSLLSYFPTRIILEAPTSSSLPHPSIIAVHPHGIASWNHFALMTDACHLLSHPAFALRRDIVATVLFRIPFLRDFVLALGCVDASPSTCHRILKAGLGLQLYVGGEREQLLTGTSSTHSLIVAAQRRGFIRLALRYNLPVIPVYAFGEDQLYSVSSWGLGWRLQVASRWRVALPLVWGRWGIWPKRRELVLVVGEAMRFEGEGESEERVDKALLQYSAEVTALYDRHRGSMPGYEKLPLKIL